MEEQKQQQSNVKMYVFIFIIMLITNAITLFFYDYYIKHIKEGTNNNIVIDNISTINDKINDLSEIVKLNNSEIKLEDRIDSKLVKEFGDDGKFLEHIAKLKKQIIQRELESKVIELDNERMARNNTIDDGNYASGYKKQIAANIFEIMMINATTKKAVVRVEDNIANVGINDNIRGFVVKDINANQIVMKNPNGEEEVLGLSYLTRKIYDEKIGDKK